jgi:hypothetical protein
MTIKEIKAEIRATRKEMKEKGIRRVSCFNAGLTSEQYHLNSQMFALEMKLKTAQKLEEAAR